MKQTIFENKQRADELIQEAIRIWRESDHPDQLEGIEQDPVFSLLMTALAYQSNELESELEQMKSDVLDEFARMLTPYEVGHAIPATAVVETALQTGVSEIELSDRHVFTLVESGASFIPLLRTRVLNMTIRSIVRMDGRRWKVSLKFDTPISDLSGFCFCIKNHNYKDLKLTISGQPLPLVSPWEFSELPLSPCFDIDTILYNQTNTYAASVSCLDLFARQNVRMYCIKSHQGKKFIPADTDSLDIVFEFTGLKEGFLFDKDNLALNTVLLVNAHVHSVDLSSATPMVRVAGFRSQSSGSDNVSQQFLHMIRPSTDQIYGKFPVEVRKVAADRFNQGSLVNLLNNLISKYYTDFYAFQTLRDEANDRVMKDLIDILLRMRDAARIDMEQRIPGVYLMLRPQADRQSQPVNLSVSYVTTMGSAVNSQLTVNSTFYMTTNDRLVTPADIKLFCYTELQTRYGITRSMVKSVTVSHRQQQERWNAGYEILAEIVLKDNTFIRRGFEDKISMAESLMQAMISVRSANIYPINVTIVIEKKKE